MEKFIIIISTLLFISCKTSKESIIINPESNSEMVKQKEREKRIAELNSFLLDKIEKINNDGITYKSFECCKDQIEADKLYSELRLSKSYRVKIQDLNRSIEAFILLNNYSYLALGGNLEMENYLLQFYDDVVFEIIRQNHEYSDGPGMEENLFHWIDRDIDNIQFLPPSKKKIVLLYRLAGQEPTLGKDLYGDISALHGDHFVLEQIFMNIDEKYFYDFYKVSRGIPNAERSSFVRSHMDKIYKGIMSGEISLKDRNDWIAKSEQDNGK